MHEKAERGKDLGRDVGKTPGDRATYNCQSDGAIDIAQ